MASAARTIALSASLLAFVAPWAPASPASTHATTPREPERIAFVRFATDRLLLMTGRLDGVRRALPLPVRDAQGPTWSPDGRRIAFVGGVRSRDGAYLVTDVDLYVARADGRRAQRLTSDALREAAPRWSPRGDALVFVRTSTAGNRSTLWIARTNGSGVRRLTSGHVDLQPSWSPDGRRIVFVRIDARNVSGVWEIRPDGSGLRRLLRIVGATRPTWSPDGRRLLLTDGATLFTVRPDGRGRRHVATLTTDARGGRIDPQPTWSQSGWIVFAQLRPGTLQRSDIWRVRPDGRSLLRVSRSPGLDSEPSLHP